MSATNKRTSIVNQPKQILNKYLQIVSLLKKQEFTYELN